MIMPLKRMGLMRLNEPKKEMTNKGNRIQDDDWPCIYIFWRSYLTERHEAGREFHTQEWLLIV